MHVCTFVRVNFLAFLNVLKNATVINKILIIIIKLHMYILFTGLGDSTYITIQDWKMNK